MKNEQVTIRVPRDKAKDIERLKKRTLRKTTEAAVTDLLKYALTLPPYFKDFDWERAEADEEITAGKPNRLIMWMPLLRI